MRNRKVRQKRLLWSRPLEMRQIIRSEANKTGRQEAPPLSGIFGAQDTMERNARVPQGGRSPVRDWIDPTRIYNITIPAGRLLFLWGLVIYPLAVIFLLLIVIIIVIETLSPSADVPDTIGIVTWVFMLAWVTAGVCISYRRFRDLGMSQRWIWLVILPVANLIFFLYLLIKAGPTERHPGG